MEKENKKGLKRVRFLLGNEDEDVKTINKKDSEIISPKSNSCKYYYGNIRVHVL